MLQPVSIFGSCTFLLKRETGRSRETGKIQTDDYRATQIKKSSGREEVFIYKTERCQSLQGGMQGHEEVTVFIAR